MKVVAPVCPISALTPVPLQAIASYFERNTIAIVVPLPAAAAYIFLRLVGNLHGEAYAWQSFFDGTGHARRVELDQCHDVRIVAKPEGIT